MSFLKKLFKKKTPEELKAELNALVEAQKRDNEMIKEWFVFKKDENIRSELEEQWDYDLNCPGCIGNFLFPPGYDD